MKTCLYNFDTLKPHFYKVKLGLTGVYIIFLIFAQKHRLWVLVRTASRGGSNEHPQSIFWAEIWKKYQIFLPENFPFLVVKFSIYLNRRVLEIKGQIMRMYIFIWPIVTPWCHKNYSLMRWPIYIVLLRELGTLSRSRTSAIFFFFFFFFFFLQGRHFL